MGHMQGRCFTLLSRGTAWLALLMGGPGLRADMVELLPAADTTLAQVAPDHNFGGANFFNAGTAKNGMENRGLLQFDIAGSVAPGSTISSVSLVLELVREPVGGGASSSFSLHRVLSPWGEGTRVPLNPGSPGLGDQAVPGEATWRDRFFSIAPWSSPGGAVGVDFVATASAGQFIYGKADSPYVFDSSAALNQDVQGWLDHPESNFGWMLKTDSEGVPGTARGFASRENSPTIAPRLVIDFQPVPEPSTWAILGLGLAGFAWRRQLAI